MSACENELEPFRYFGNSLQGQCTESISQTALCCRFVSSFYQKSNKLPQYYPNPPLINLPKLEPSKTSGVLPNQISSHSTMIGLPADIPKPGVGFGEQEERELEVQADPSSNSA